jgi:pimeloyl-ACP methyl ester carboxylesterase
MSAKVYKGAARIESRWTTVGGLCIHARVAVGQPLAAGIVPVVLVHGLVASSLYMVPTAKRLAPFYPVYAPDLPGFGRSDKPSRTLKVPELADALGAWMDAERLERVVLVGNSLGCQVVADLAARAPHKVGGIVLTGPSVDPTARTRGKQFMRLLLDATRERPSLIFVWLRDLYEAGLLGAWQTSAHALEDYIEEKLPRVRAPALVVCGTRDPVAPQAWAEQVSRLLPRGRLAVIRGGPHALNYTTPDELALLIREFIKREVSEM